MAGISDTVQLLHDASQWFSGGVKEMRVSCAYSLSGVCPACIFEVQLSLDYPNTWSPHLIRMAEIFGYQNEPRPSIIRVPLHAKSTNYVQSSYTNVLVLDIMRLQWTEQGSKLYC